MSGREKAKRKKKEWSHMRKRDRRDFYVDSVEKGKDHISVGRGGEAPLL